jgi:hypothetical protein
MVNKHTYTCRWDDGKHWNTELSDSEAVTVLKSKQKETIMQTQEVTTNTTKHKYADILIAIANGEQIEGKNEKDQWCVVDSNIVLYEIYSTGKVDLNVRVKPKTININGHEVPVALKVKPGYGTGYYYPSLINESKYNWAIFEGDEFDNQILDKGLMHLTVEAAQKHAEALLSFTKV